jgi:hypothetical protein
LVIADSFYEWKKAGKQRRPYRILLKSEELFAFAGIWEEDTNEEGQSVKTFAIITTEANELVKKVHNRMPVILRQEGERQWLDDALTAEKRLLLLSPDGASAMKMYEVSTRVNRATENEPGLIQHDPITESRNKLGLLWQCTISGEFSSGVLRAKYSHWESHTRYRALRSHALWLDLVSRTA